MRTVPSSARARSTISVTSLRFSTRSPSRPCASAIFTKSGPQRRRRIAAFVEELLPLPHHAEVAVVDDRDVDLDPFLRRRGELRLRHLEAAITDNRPHLRVGTGDLRPDRRGHRKPHRTEAAGRDQRTRRFVMVVLCLPHLVLTDVSDHDSVAAGNTPDVVDDMRHRWPVSGSF